MKDECFNIEEKLNQNKSNILNEAVIELENIINDINNQDKELITNKIQTTIINIKNFVSEYQNNLNEIKKYIDILEKDNYDIKKKFDELSNKKTIKRRKKRR